jgi:flagella basal body P-ring formation protein FlgA
MIWAALLIVAAEVRGPVKLPPPDVQHGDKVAVTVTVGNVTLAFEAEAESAGRTGETIIIRNPENGRRFIAKVQEKGKVYVKK